MSWAKISDDFADDCETLSDAAFRLHVEGLCWNGRKLLDCRIPASDLRRFAKNPSAVDELLATGWWSQDGDYFVIRHHAVYQRSRKAVLDQQAANSANGKKGGRPKANKETHSVSDSVTDSVSESAVDRTPSAADRAGLPHGKTDSLNDSKSKRDRTGQAHLGEPVLIGENETDIPDLSGFGEFLPPRAVAS